MEVIPTPHLQDDLIKQYQRLEAEHAIQSQILKDFQQGKQDERAHALLGELSSLTVEQTAYQKQLHVLREKATVFENDVAFMKAYQDRLEGQDHIQFGVLEKLSGFRGNFLSYQENEANIEALGPLVENLKIAAKEKIQRYKELNLCYSDPDKFIEFAKTHIEGASKNLSRWGLAKHVLLGKNFINGIPEELFYSYKEILDEQFRQTHQQVEDLRKELFKQQERYTKMQAYKVRYEEKSTFLARCVKKNATKGVVVFTAQDYINGFRKKALAYKSILEDKSLCENQLSLTGQKIDTTQNALSKRQEELALLYQNTILEIQQQVQSLYQQKQEALQRCLSSLNEENPTSRAKLFIM